MSPASEVEAVTWSKNFGSFALPCNGEAHGAQVSISYNGSIINNSTAALIPSGSTIPVGTQFTLTPNAFGNTDISWSATGFSLDTPYGVWAPNAVGYSNIGGAAVKAKVIVSKPTVTFSHGGTAGLSCNPAGNVCTVTSSGTISLTISFSATAGNFYFLNLDSRPGSPTFGAYCPYTLPFATTLKSVSFNLNAVQPNLPPLAPSVVPVVGNTNLASEPQSFTFLTTDPDGNQIRYGIDWGNDGSVDVWAPAVGRVNSGIPQVGTKSWANPGTYTIKVLAEDSTGAQSAWTSYDVTINNPAPCAEGVVLNWIVGANSCNGTTVNTNSGANGLVIDNLLPTLGNALFQCTNGIWAALPNPGATCAVLPDYTLTLAKAGVAATAGTITSAPAGINCGLDCTEDYTSGTVVTLNGSVTNGSVVFSGDCVGTGSCVVNMDAAKSVTATVSCSAPAYSWDGDSCEIPPVAVPTGLTVTPQACDTGALYLDWDDAAGAASYSVYTSTGVPVDNPIGSNYTFTGALNTNYSFYIRANNASGIQSGDSLVASGVTAGACVVALPAPTGLTTTPGACGTDRIDVSWNSVAGASGYDLEIDGVWKSLGNVLIYAHLGLIPNSGHTYKVRAWNVIVPGVASMLEVENAPNLCICTATTINHCDLVDTINGQSSGSCESGYNGSCNYSCNSPAWILNNNDCAAAPLPPTITIKATPELIRSGGTADIKVDINDAARNLTCTVLGVDSVVSPDPVNFNHEPLNPPFKPVTNQSYVTKKLTSAQTVQVNCSDGANTFTEEIRIKVLPSIQEI